MGRQVAIGFGEFYRGMGCLGALIFVIGGEDPQGQANMIWVSHDQHAELVRFWNGVYRSVKSR